MLIAETNLGCVGPKLRGHSHSTRLLAATTLRNVLGTRNLAEILSERESISSTMQSSLDEATDPWGVKVERVEMWVGAPVSVVLDMSQANIELSGAADAENSDMRCADVCSQTYACLSILNQAKYPYGE